MHLDDVFKKGRYIVIHKLGHGGFATVWLARDTIRERYVALKILAARLSRDCPEVEILRRLKKSEDHEGKAYVMSMLDHFWIEGPNGNHLCVVSEVGGPSIKQFNDCPGFTSGTRRLRGDVARKVALQATEGLAYIHSTGIVHGGSSDCLVDNLELISKQTSLQRIFSSNLRTSTSGMLLRFTSD